MGISHVAADGPADALAEALDGAVIVDGLLDPDLLARFNAEPDPLLEAARPDHGLYVNDGVARPGAGARAVLDVGSDAGVDLGEPARRAVAGHHRDL
jgi:hypothetical protein